MTRRLHIIAYPTLLLVLGLGQLAHASTNCSQPGVLVSCVSNDTTFSLYLSDFFSSNLDFIFILALVMIVFSGVQYMTSGFSTDASKQAKQRIIGIIGGVFFYFLTTLILKQISGHF